jgi:hypothetical protein
MMVLVPGSHDGGQTARLALWHYANPAASQGQQALEIEFAAAAGRKAKD